MVSEHRRNLDEIVDAVQTGRMKRRVFLERAIALGLSSSAAAGILAACGGGSSSSSTSNGPVTIKLWDYSNPAGKGYLALIDRLYEGQSFHQIHAQPFLSLI